MGTLNNKLSSYNRARLCHDMAWLCSRTTDTSTWHLTSYDARWRSSRWLCGIDKLLLNSNWLTKQVVAVAASVTATLTVTVDM